MNAPSSPSVKSFLPTALILIILGWGGLLWLLNYTSPSGGTRWLFFFTGVMAITGTVLPLSAFLNRRFPSRPAPTGFVIVRQALWAGVYFATLAWLQINNVLNPTLAFLLALGLALIEWLLRLRERSLWKPDNKA